MAGKLLLSRRNVFCSALSAGLVASTGAPGALRSRPLDDPAFVHHYLHVIKYNDWFEGIRFLTQDQDDIPTFFEPDPVFTDYDKSQTAMVNRARLMFYLTRKGS